MTYKIRIIIPYFGKFKNSINLFLDSCAKNPNFEWLIFTDDAVLNTPSNVEIINCNLDDIKNRIESTLGFTVSLEAPYKLCDFRPAFGLIFQKELKGYDFWGWGDVDLIYGNLSKFITNDCLSNYDKIYPCGHLSILRNCNEVNTCFMREVKGTLNYKEVFSNPSSYIFDEYKGLNEKLLSIGMRVYGNIDFADMDIVYKRFRTADKKTIKMVFPKFLFTKYIPKNYKNQTFLITSNGAAYRVYIDSKGICKEKELVYIHYRHDIPYDGNLNKKDDYFITSKGFLRRNSKITKKTIEYVNPYNGFIEEFIEYLHFFKERLILIFGSNKKIRNIIRLIKGKNRI